MLSTLFSKIATEAVTTYVKAKVTRALDRKASVTLQPEQIFARVEASIDRHLRDVSAWSARMQFYGMSRGEETDDTTIPLRFHTEPRRFRSIDATQIYRETDVLNTGSNYLLLGDPGAGKTTALKRLANLLLTSPAISAADTYQFPIVLRLREFSDGTSLFDELANVLGVRVDDFKPGTAEWWPQGQKWVGDVRFETAVAELLDATSAVVMIDGLDETSRALRGHLERELEQLVRGIRTAKIVVSCRTGDYTTLIEGFDVIEIASLDDDEILQISSAWLTDPASFRDQLHQLPYKDIADRPLLLTQLLFIYRRYGYLPEQPNQVYKKVVALLLHEWDAERRISRTSRYANFVTERKAAFLAALAYHLTFRVRRKTFSLDDLRRAYLAVREQFDLPSDEATQVAAELETHTGILVIAGAFTYEFAHLSLQEYLCAEYLVREPFAEYVTDYMLDYPAPVAVAVSLSAEPSVWFAALFLQRNERYTTNSLHSFLARVLLERPYFSRSDMLGLTILKLYYEAAASKSTRVLLDKLALLPAVRASVESALSHCVKSSDQIERDDVVRLDVTKTLPNRRGLVTPRIVAISRTMLNELSTSSNG